MAKLNYLNLQWMITANVPGFGRLIDGIQRKKSRETMVIALVVGVLLCFVIWWVDTCNVYTLLLALVSNFHLLFCYSAGGFLCVRSSPAWGNQEPSERLR